MCNLGNAGLYSFCNTQNSPQSPTYCKRQEKEGKKERKNPKPHIRCNAPKLA